MHVDADPQSKEVDEDSQIELKGAPQVVIEVSKHLVTNVAQFTEKEWKVKQGKKTLKKQGSKYLYWC